MLIFALGAVLLDLIVVFFFGEAWIPRLIFSFLVSAYFPRKKREIGSAALFSVGIAALYLSTNVDSVLKLGLIDPLIEENLYRLVLCSVLLKWFSVFPTVFISAAVFVVLHAAYGTLDWTNVFGGFVLSAVFVKTRSWALCLWLHGLGNLVLIFPELLR